MKTEKKKIILIVLIAFVVYGYAFAGQTIYVDADAAGANDGSSWADAYNYLQDALFNALPSTEIRVAQGIYKPHLNSYSAQPPSREDTFQLKNGIILIGGFAGFGEPDPDARDIGAYETLLSGDLNANDPEVKDACDLIADPCRADNCYHVVTGSLDSAITVLDGFTITGGNANWEPPWPYDHRMKGGGMYCSEGSSTTVANCLFHDNSAIWGGGMYIGVGSPILTNCTFRANAAERHAGALEIECAYMPIINHAFIGNFAGVNGGAVWNFDTAPVYVNCIFSGNKAGGDGGAMWNVDSSNYTLINCTFANNTAAGLGGAIDSDEWPILTNCILWSNRDVSGMGELAHVHAYHGPSAINYCCVQGWTGVLGGTGNIGDDPFFVDTDGIDDIVGTEDDNLRLLADSPCIDAGDNSVVTITTDLDGNPRIVNGSVDMGAYEYQGPFKQCYYVDGINGDDNNDGLSPETAFATIQKGIDSTQNGDLVIVLPGTYTGPGNRDIDFKGKAITVCGENGPNNCIVDCEAQGRGFYFHRGENADSLLEGLTIMNGSI